MILATDDTIYAIASARGGAARGVVRVAGPQAIACVRDLFTADDPSRTLDEICRASAIPGALRIAAFAAPIPCTLYLWPGPASYTRSAMVELHTVGSPPVLDAILAALCQDDVRLAQPGEFTLRAFLAGRMDLTQAEAVLGVIDAHDQQQLDVALRQLAGGLAGPLSDVRQSLLNLLAELEAGLDFVEEDIEFITSEQLCAGLAEAAQHVTSVFDQIAGRSDRRELMSVALFGAANVGKSTLFNAILTHTDAADHAAPSIVTEQPGTTRDYRTATITHHSSQWQLVDTAGIEHVGPDDLPATSAQAATTEQLRDVDIRVLCLDVSVPQDQHHTSRDAFDLVIATKADLARDEHAAIQDVDVITSGATHIGLDELLSRVAEVIAEKQISAGDSVASTAARCRESLNRVSECLASAHSLATANAGHELIAAELRIALDHLGQIVGVVYTDDILDRIFGQFCIGK